MTRTRESHSSALRPVTLMVTAGLRSAGELQAQLWFDPSGEQENLLATGAALGDIGADVGVWRVYAERHALRIAAVVAVCRYLAHGTIILRDEDRVPCVLGAGDPRDPESERYCLYADGTREDLPIDEHVTLLRPAADVAVEALRRCEYRDLRRRPTPVALDYACDVPRYSLIWPTGRAGQERLGYLDVSSREGHRERVCVYRDGTQRGVHSRTVAVYRSIEFLAQQYLLRAGAALLDPGLAARCAALAQPGRTGGPAEPAERTLP